VLNTLRILENLDQHPTADRLLINMIDYAARPAGWSSAPAPADLDRLLAQIGYD